MDFAVKSGYAPEEERLVLDAVLREPNDERVVRRLRRQRRKGDPLGFGAGEVAALLGPLLMAVLDESFRAVAGAAAGALVTTGFRRVFRRRATTRLPALPPDQLRKVHDLVVEKLVESEIPEETARAVAEHISGRLALGNDEGEGEGRDDQASGG
ncbi:hypothetical protein [Streptomyces syringium]|uniref:hypothetical protein n=1 Tax=Streptomyces syringium TaxID=76729 RepID=UPI0033E2238F